MAVQFDNDYNIALTFLEVSCALAMGYNNLYIICGIPRSRDDATIGEKNNNIYHRRGAFARRPRAVTTVIITRRFG